MNIENKREEKIRILASREVKMEMSMRKGTHLTSKDLPSTSPMEEKKKQRKELFSLFLSSRRNSLSL